MANGLDRIGLAALAETNVIIEVIVERLDVKRTLIARLNAMTGRDTLIASNTSSLPIAAIASACQRPQRVCGMHFFNPVPLMRLVDNHSRPEDRGPVSEALASLAPRMAREPVLGTDISTFLVNRVGRAPPCPKRSACLAKALPAWPNIDRILTGAAGFRIGP